MKRRNQQLAHRRLEFLIIKACETVVMEDWAIAIYPRLLSYNITRSLFVWCQNYPRFKRTAYVEAMSGATLKKDMAMVRGIMRQIYACLAFCVCSLMHLRHDLQSKELPSTRIQPDRRWFGNTRVVNQQELEFFREELESRLSSNYTLILNDNQKRSRVHLLDREPFSDAFGPKTKRKRPKLLTLDYESLIKKADGTQCTTKMLLKRSMVPAHM